MRAPFMAGTFLPGEVRLRDRRRRRARSGGSAWAARSSPCIRIRPCSTCLQTAAVAVPSEVPAARAVLAANMETALNAVWDAGAGSFGKVAVVGAGVVGALTGLLLRQLASADVTLVDVDPARAAVASRFGLAFAAPDRGADRVRPGRSCQRDRRRSRDGARLGGRRSHRARAQLVRQRRRAGAAGRRLPQPPAETDRKPGRQGRAVAPPRLDASPPPGKGARDCWPTTGSTCSSSRRSPSKICRPPAACSRSGERHSLPDCRLCLTRGEHPCTQSKSAITS